MNIEEFAKAMAFLGVAYNKEFSQEQIGVWYNFFADTKLEDFKNAIKRYISKSKYLPSIAEIKSELATLNVKELQLNAESEWELVLQAVRRWGRLDNVAFEKITQDTIKAIGIRRLEMIETNQVPFIKKEFIEIWNDKRDGIEKVYTQNMLTYEEQIRKQILEEDRRLLLNIGE
jgi:hypothetical protein